MTLKKILRILGKKRSAEIAGTGKSSSWHWFQTGERQKVPETQGRREDTLHEMMVASERKERYLSRERAERERITRLSQYSEKLKKLRRGNAGDN